MVPSLLVAIFGPTATHNPAPVPSLPYATVAPELIPPFVVESLQVIPSALVTIVFPLPTATQFTTGTPPPFF